MQTASASFGRLVAPQSIHLAAFVAMVDESVAAGEPEQRVVQAKVLRRPALYLRQLEAERGTGSARFWLVSNGEVLATATLRRTGSAWLGHLGFFVRPSRRRQGIGRALMIDLVTAARVAGVVVPRAVVETGNQRSRRAIEAAGGRLLDTVSEYGLERCIYAFDAR